MRRHPTVGCSPEQTLEAVIMIEGSRQVKLTSLLPHHLPDEEVGGGVAPCRCSREMTPCWIYADVRSMMMTSSPLYL